MSAEELSAKVAADDSPNMRQHDHSGFRTSDGFYWFEPVHVADPVDHGIDLP